MIDNKIKKYLTEKYGVLKNLFPETEKLYDEKWSLIDKFEKDLQATKDKYSVAMQKAFDKELRPLLQQAAVDKQLYENIEGEIESLFEEDENEYGYEAQENFENGVRKLRKK